MLKHVYFVCGRYSLYRTQRLSPKQADQFAKVEEEIDGLHFWEMPVSGRSVKAGGWKHLEPRQQSFPTFSN